jgi:hypothetical protein
VTGVPSPQSRSRSPQRAFLGYPQMINDALQRLHIQITGARPRATISKIPAIRRTGFAESRKLRSGGAEWLRGRLSAGPSQDGSPRTSLAASARSLSSLLEGFFYRATRKSKLLGLMGEGPDGIGRLSRVYILRRPLAFGFWYHSSYIVHCHSRRFHQTLKSDSSFNVFEDTFISRWLLLLMKDPRMGQT